MDCYNDYIVNDNYLYKKFSLSLGFKKPINRYLGKIMMSSISFNQNNITPDPVLEEFILLLRGFLTSFFVWDAYKQSLFNLLLKDFNR